ncbi:MAG: protein CsiD [Paenibacillus sp.]|jgi:protein CsiD|nr:protein CsiD [Paenibacillus sp.]
MPHDARFTVHPHPTNPRLRHITLDNEAISGFLQDVAAINTQELEYVPFSRFFLAHKLQSQAGGGFAETLRAIVQDRTSGGFTVNVQGQTDSLDDYVKFATAITHLIGIPNFDAMSGNYYARFTVKHTDTSDSYLRQAYRLFTLHTDGTFADEPTDWLIMMKLEERNAVGGESRLLHLDDWEQLSTYLNHPLAFKQLAYKSPPSKNVSQSVERTTFYIQHRLPCICFIDQFAYPKTIEEALYLRSLSESMEASQSVRELALPAGELIMLNNNFWLHGRAPFQQHNELYRELMRIRGVFADV